MIGKRWEEIDELRADGLSHREIGERLGINSSTVTRTIQSMKRAAERGKLGFTPVMPGFVVKQVSSKEGDAWVKQVKEPGPVFEMPPGQVLKEVSAYVDPDMRVLGQWIKTKGEKSTADLVEALDRHFANPELPAALAAPEPPLSGLRPEWLNVFPVADAHVGLLAWGRENGGENYDLRIGAARMRETSTELMGIAAPAERALIIGLGDYYHTDDQTNETPARHHKLDTDGRYHKIIDVGIQMQIDLIDLALQKHRHVTLVNLEGNHDPHAHVALMFALAAWYRNEPRVTIVKQTAAQFYYRFGRNLIGAQHGHRMKPDAMAMHMAATQKMDWALTDHRWYLFGHFHKLMADTIGGVHLECFPTITGTDAYTAGRGYLSNKCLQAITLDKEGGEKFRSRINIALPSRPPAHVPAELKHAA